MGSDFAEVWERILHHKRKIFTTVRGLKFSYSILGNWVVISDTDFRITKNSFQTAYSEMPVADPEDFTDKVQGKYFIHALLTDPRIDQ